jgi:hypothetical protein
MKLRFFWIVGFMIVLLGLPSNDGIATATVI